MVRDGLTLIFIIVLMFRLDAGLDLVLLAVASHNRHNCRLLPQLYAQDVSDHENTAVPFGCFCGGESLGMQSDSSFSSREGTAESISRIGTNRIYARNFREIRTNVLFNRSFDILGNLSVAFVTWMGGMAVLRRRHQFGVLYAFITYIRMFFQPINNDYPAVEYAAIRYRIGQPDLGHLC